MNKKVPVTVTSWGDTFRRVEFIKHAKMRTTKYQRHVFILNQITFKMVMEGLGVMIDEHIQTFVENWKV